MRAYLDKKYEGWFGTIRLARVFKNNWLKAFYILIKFRVFKRKVILQKSNIDEPEITLSIEEK